MPVPDPLNSNPNHSIYFSSTGYRHALPRYRVSSASPYAHARFKCLGYRYGYLIRQSTVRREVSAIRAFGE